MRFTKAAKKCLSTLLATSMLCSAFVVPTAVADTEQNSAQQAKEIVSNMTLEQKVGQKIMMAFRSWYPEDGSPSGAFKIMNDEVGKVIQDYELGGVILFAENIVETEQTTRLTDGLQKAAKEAGIPPLLIATDQEGGIVYRLGSGTAMPGNMALGAARDPQLAYDVGGVFGAELKSVGINVNFAPSLDVNCNPSNPVINLRSIGSKPELVSEIGTQIVKGIQDQNVSAAAKHFPGHGDTSTDSHVGLPAVDKSYDELKQTELAPFQAAIDGGIDMIMTAHIAFPQVVTETFISKKDGSEIHPPATLSKEILTDILRGDMGYEGVIVTDAMEMQAITQHFGEIDAVKIAFNAGVDIALMPTTVQRNSQVPKLDAIVTSVCDAVRAGEISEDQITESAERIIKLKIDRGVMDLADDQTPVDDKVANAEAVVGCEAHRAIEREASYKATTVVKNEGGVLPLQPKDGEKVLFIAAYSNEIPGMQYGLTRLQAEGLVPKSVTFDTYVYTSQTAVNDELKAKIDAADYVVMDTEMTSVSHLKPTHWVTAAPKAVTAYCNEIGTPCVLMSVGQPYDVSVFDDCKAYVATYGYKGMDPTESDGSIAPQKAFGPNIPGGIDIIFGYAAATGKLPVDVPVVENNAYTDQIKYPFGFGLETEINSAAKAKQIVKDWTVEQKIGQKIIMDFRSWNSGGASGAFQVMNDEVKAVIQNYDLGGVILFAENIVATEQTVRLTDALQKAALEDGNLPLMIAADQEGGIVYRLGSGTGMPGNMALGATRSTENAYTTGTILGSELASVGINVNYAPVLDTTCNPSNPVINLRSISSRPELVAELGVPMMQGIQSQHVSATAKHFPGHGDTVTDSHYGMPSVDKSYDELKKVELLPFQAAIDAGIDMIMTAHIQYPQIVTETFTSKKDGSQVKPPATLSREILEGVLRQDMGFEGVIVTDSMTMQGITEHFGEIEAVKLAFNAGVDMAVKPTFMTEQSHVAKLDAIVREVSAAVRSGEISEEKITESCERIVKMKIDRGIMDIANDTRTVEEKIENAQQIVGSKEHRELEREIAFEGATVIKNENNLLPYKPVSGDNVLVIGAYDNEIPGMQYGLRRLQAEGVLPQDIQVDTYVYTNNTSVTPALKAKLDSADYVVMITEMTALSHLKPTHWVTAGPRAVTQYCNEIGTPCALMGIGQPYDAANQRDAQAYVAVYGYKGMDPTDADGENIMPESAFGPNIPAGIDAIFGYKPTVGKLPVDAPATDANGNYTDEIAYAFGHGITTNTDTVALTGLPEGGATRYATTITADRDVNFFVNGVKVERVSKQLSLRDEGAYRIQAFGTDGSKSGIYTVVIDRTAPVLRATVEHYGITNQDVTFTVNEESTFYNGTEVIAEGTELTLSESGVYNIRAIDKAGNYTAFYRVTILKEAPVLTGVPEGITRNNLSIRSDSKVIFTVNGVEAEDYAYGLRITEEGKYTVKATDMAGNETEVSFEIDRTKPTFTATVASGKPTGEDITITASETVDFVVDGVTVATGTAYTVTESCVVSIYDIAGNYGGVYKANIDKTAPVLSAVIEGTNKAVENGATVTQNVTVKTSKPAQFIIGDGEPTARANFVKLKAKGTHTVKAVDMLGNVSEVFTVTIQ